MRLIALLIIAASLVVALIGALTAYTPRIDAPGAEERLAGLHLNAPAGARTDDSGATVPIVPDEAELTPERLAELRAAGVERVKVREFAPGRWTGWWLFAIGCCGLLGAGLYLRAQSKRATAMGVPRGTAGAALDPSATLAAIRAEVASVLEAIGAAPVSADAGAGGGGGGGGGAFAAQPLEQDANRVVIERIGRLQATHMPAFIDARPQLVAAFGMSGYARLMDSYAAAERAINRAWSAAADDHEAEAVTSLQRGLALLDESARRMPE